MKCNEIISFLRNSTVWSQLPTRKPTVSFINDENKNKIHVLEDVLVAEFYQEVVDVDLDCEKGIGISEKNIEMRTKIIPHDKVKISNDENDENKQDYLRVNRNE